jgi:hypothetical protein
MNNVTFDQYIADCKKLIKDDLERSIVKVLRRYENRAVATRMYDSLRYELDQLFDYYINCGCYANCFINKNSICEIFNSIIHDYYSHDEKFSEPSFVEDSIRDCISKFGYPI